MKNRCNVSKVTHGATGALLMTMWVITVIVGIWSAHHVHGLILRALHVLSHRYYLVLSTLGPYVPSIIIKPHCGIVTSRPHWGTTNTWRLQDLLLSVGHQSQVWVLHLQGLTLDNPGDDPPPAMLEAVCLAPTSAGGSPCLFVDLFLTPAPLFRKSENRFIKHGSPNIPR